MVMVSEKECNLIIELRRRVQDLSSSVDEGTAGTAGLGRLGFSGQFEDHFLIRWLRARNGDLDAAEVMLRNYLHWIATNKLLHESTSFTPSSCLEAGLLYKFTGFDHEGRPVLFLPFGRWALRRLLDDGFIQDVCRFQYRLLGKLMASIEQQRKLTGHGQFVVVGDSAELTFWKLASYETVQVILRFFREFESYYPELLHSCYIVNTPLVFSYIFNLVKPLLSSHTLSKVKLFNYDQTKWAPALKSALPADSIPAEYGGTGDKML